MDDLSAHRARRRLRVAIAWPTEFPPCPPWCVLGTDHEYTELRYRRSTFSRYHLDNCGYAYVTQEEFNRDGMVWLGPLSIFTDDVADAEGLNTEEARNLAAELLAAAVRFDDIEGCTGDETTA